MKISNQKSTTFYCFTPMVSLATFLIEMLFVLFVLIRYKSTPFRDLCVMILLCLGLFQLAEYGICRTNAAAIWVKIGYISITLLPALAMHLVSIITRKQMILSSISYLLGFLLIGFIVFLPELTLTPRCVTHYVDISAPFIFLMLHGLYYAVFIVLGIFTLWSSKKGKKADSKLTYWMIIAYVVFVIPSLILFYLRVISHTALPSVMCGFAVLTAFIIVGFLLPRYYALQKKNVSRKKR